MSSEATTVVHAEAQGKLRAYPRYRGVESHQLQEIPDGWEVRRLKRVCQLAYGSSLAEDVRHDGSVAVFGSNGPIGMHDASNTLGPCLVVGRKGSFGKVQYSQVPVFAIDTTYFVDRRFTSENLRWLFYVLMDLRLDSSSRDSAIPGLDRSDAYWREVPWCPATDQAAIATFLDRETAKIDALVAEKWRLIELLQEKRIALVAHAVTKGLDMSVPMRSVPEGSIGDIPAHWAVKRLWHLTPSDRRIMYGIVLPGPNVEGGVPIVKGGDVAARRLSLDLLNRTSFEIEASYARSRLRGGDLVYAIRGSIGDVAMVPDEIEGANITQDAARVSYTAEIDGRWLLHALESSPVRAQLEAGAVGATIKGINIRDLKRALVPVPPSVEQSAIAEFLGEETRRFERLASRVSDGIDRLTELRSALISAAVTGKIDVRGEVA